MPLLQCSALCPAGPPYCPCPRCCSTGSQGHGCGPLPHARRICLRVTTDHGLPRSWWHGAAVGHHCCAGKCPVGVGSPGAAARRHLRAPGALCEQPCCWESCFPAPRAAHGRVLGAPLRAAGLAALLPPLPGTSLGQEDECCFEPTTLRTPLCSSRNTWMHLLPVPFPNPILFWALSSNATDLPTARSHFHLSPPTMLLNNAPFVQYRSLDPHF